MRQMVGGQAVIEGVLIKAPKRISVACRTPKGRIVFTDYSGASLLQKSAFFRLPFVRGFVSLVELMVVGFKALSWSADKQTGDEEHLETWHVALTLLLSLSLAIGLFFVLPFYLSLFAAEKNTLAFNVLDGVLRLLFFLAYILAISFMPDVRRLYQYHGAEHKAVHCYEAGKKLNAKNVQRYSTCHPRCGTSLIIFVIAVSIVVFMFIRFDALWANLLLRIVVLPVIAGVSYELLKLTAKVADVPVLSWLTLPGIWVQKITTQEPSDRQVEVAIAALKRAVR